MNKQQQEPSTHNPFLRVSLTPRLVGKKMNGLCLVNTPVLVRVEFLPYIIFLDIYLHRYPVGESDKTCSLNERPFSNFHNPSRMHMVSLGLFRRRIFIVTIILDYKCIFYESFKCLLYLAPAEICIKTGLPELEPHDHSMPFLC
jgi:hypothetical protein